MPIVLLVIVLLAVGVGAYLLTSSDDDGVTAAGDDPALDASDGGADPAAGGTDPGDDASASGGGGAAAPSGSPDEVVAAYVAAVVDGDCGTMTALVSETMLSGMTREAAVEECEHLTGDDTGGRDVFAALDLRPATEEGDVATVDAFGEYEGTPLVIAITLVRTGDGWLIDNIA